MNAPGLEDLLRQALDCHRKGMLREAEAGYRKALELSPDHPDALHLLGMLARQVGNLPAAEQLIRGAIRIAGNLAAYHSSLGLTLLASNRLAEAIEAFKRATELDPNSCDFFLQLGSAYFTDNQAEQSERATRRAMEMEPGNAIAHFNLGNALTMRDKLDEAFEEYEKAMRARPDWSNPATNQAVIRFRQDRIDEAIELAKKAIALCPGEPDLHINLATMLKDMGRLDEAMERQNIAISLNPDYAKARSNLIFTMHYAPGVSRGEIEKQYEQWNRRMKQRVGSITPAALKPVGDRKIRVGFVSPDFRIHPVGMMIAPVMAKLNRERFTVIAYAELTRRDEWTETCRKSADLFRETEQLGDDALAQLIRDDEVDILVDLASHTAGNRLPALARKPAPIMGTWLAYCETTGVEGMDFRISDRWMDPVPDHGIEKTVYLPNGYWCYPAPTAAGEVGELPAKRNGFITFGCLNAVCKMNAEVIDAFARAMKAAPGSKIILHAPAGSARERILKRFAFSTIDESRVLFVGKQSKEDYFLTHQRIDIALDVFPYNGGMTTCDALWMGVPVVSRVGERGVGRAGLSILSNIGLPELAGRSVEEYVRIASELATDWERLSALRRGLRARMSASPLMDMDRFVKDVETTLLGLLPFDAGAATIGGYEQEKRQND